MTIVYKQHHGEGVPRVSRPQSKSSPSERMLIQSTLPAASRVGGQTPSARACPPASSNLAPQLQLLSLLSASSTFTNFSIEETPQAGPDTVFLILLGASRPQPREHPDSRSGWRWRSWPRSSLREGVQGGSAGSGWGWGGQSRSRGSDQGSAARRAGGFQLPRDSRGLGTGRPPNRTGSEVSAAGCPDRGLSGCTLHWATPAPSFQHFGVTGMGPSLRRPISGRTGACAPSRKPDPRRVGVGVGGGGDLVGWLLPSPHPEAPTPWLP